MKNVKLKQTKLCYLILLMPLLLSAAIWLLTIVIADVSAEESFLRYLPIIVLAVIIAAAVICRKLWSVWLVLLTAVFSVDRWNKDRQFYFTEVNGRTVEEAVELIKLRMNHYAKELTVGEKGKGLLGAYKKRRHSWNADTSGFEDFYILYEAETLTKDFCSNAVTECKSIMRKNAEKGIYPFLQTRRERKKPVTRSCALIIVCNTAESDAASYVRRNFTKGHTGLAMCICEMSTGRYFLNGSVLSSEGRFAENAEEISLNLIKKTVFCNKLGLKENSYFVPTTDLPYSPEKTLCEAFADIKNDLKNSENEARHTAKRLKDGEVFYDGELVYYKKDGRTLTFSVVDEDEAEGESNSDKKTILTERSWSYPNHSKMSKKDYAEALEKISEYLTANEIPFEFADFDKWLEQE